MKNWIVFILIFIGSLFQETRACWFYPYGEDLRVSFLNPALFNLQQWRTFHFTSQSFAPDEPQSWDEYDANIGLWMNYCNNKVPADAIREVVYGYSYENLITDTRNSMLLYLKSAKDTLGIEYLKFAKECELFNRFHSDPWERDVDADRAMRSRLQKEAIRRIHQKNLHPQIKKRYAFLAIRLSFYNSDPSAVRKLFNEHFHQSEQRDILYYWSLYFKNLHEKDSCTAAFHAAQIFHHAPDKRFAVLSSFRSSLPIEKILQLAATNKEKSNVYVLSAILRHDKALPDLRALYRLAPDHEAMQILILREINKLEDWIYTPYYTNWEPSVRSNTFGYSESDNGSDVNTYPLLRKRIRDDRKYAGELLRFINSLDINLFKNKRLLDAAKIQLLFMTQQYTQCVQHVDAVIPKLPHGDSLSEQLLKMKALAITASQSSGKAIIPAEIEHTLKSFSHDHRFMFSIARELEFLGNTTLAAAIFALIESKKVTSSEYDYYMFGYREPPLVWKGTKKHTIVYDDYFDNYFNYLNFNYSTDQIEQIIKAADDTSGGSFVRWLFTGLVLEKSRLLDLLGTKYIRLNQLQNAADAFVKIPGFYWLTWYSPWERSNVFYLFDQDPFYQLKYTPQFIDHNDHEVLNKYVVTRKLIRFLERAGDPDEPDRDYYYFLVANCYYNMSYYGNSWMMRRFFRSSDIVNRGHPDDKEYYQCNLASLYYGKAKQVATHDGFKALCLAMMGKCERHRLGYIYNEERYDLSWQEREKLLQKRNRYIALLYNEYPEYADDITSSCELFKTLFELRR